MPRSRAGVKFSWDNSEGGKSARWDYSELRGRGAEGSLGLGAKGDYVGLWGSHESLQT